MRANRARYGRSALCVPAHCVSVDTRNSCVDTALDDYSGHLQYDFVCFSVCVISLSMAEATRPSTAPVSPASTYTRRAAHLSGTTMAHLAPAATPAPAAALRRRSSCTTTARRQGRCATTTRRVTRAARNSDLMMTSTTRSCPQAERSRSEPIIASSKKMCKIYIVIMDSMAGMFSSHVRVPIGLVHASGIMPYILYTYELQSANDHCTVNV